MTGPVAVAATEPLYADITLPAAEAIAQYGPFVMNTREEIEQALRDYQAGTLAGPAAGTAPPTSP